MAKGYKTGGRIRGSSNLVNRQIKEQLCLILEDEVRNLPELLGSLKSEEKIHILLKLLPYVVPRVISEKDQKQEPTIIYLDTIDKNA